MLFLKINNFLNKNLINITIIIVILIVTNINKNLKLYKNDNGIIENDAISYYAYLPSFFIYKDISLKFLENKEIPCNYIIWAKKTNIDRYVIKTTMGVAYAYLPFFLITHYYLKITNQKACGYSEPYKIAIICSTLLYLFIGLFFLKRILKIFFKNKWLIAFTIIIIVFGTNLLFYTTYSPAYSHVYSFALISAFIYFSIIWAQKPTIKYSILLGFLIGWISLIRPTNIIIFVFTIVLYFSNHSLKKIIFDIHNFSLIVFMAFIMWLPQLIYWKYVTGNFFYYSYGESEKFFFLKPRILKGLLGFRKGFFIYTPIMFFAFCGLIPLFKKYKFQALTIIITTLIYIYITLSWWCWWYGGSLGQRSFIDFYALWSIPLTAFFAYVIKIKNLIIKTILVLLIFFASFMNIMYTIQIRNGALHYDSMTWAAFKCSFLTTKPRCDFYSLLCQPDYEMAQKGIDICHPVK